MFCFCETKVGHIPQRTLVKCFDLPPFLKFSLPDCSEWLTCLVGVVCVCMYMCVWRGCILLPPPPPALFFFLPLARGSSLVLGAGHLQRLRLFGANVQVGNILRAPGQTSWGGRRVDERYHTAPCGLSCSWLVVVWL